MLGHEDIRGPHGLGPRAPHPDHLPVVHDLVVALRDQAHAVVDDAIAVAHHHSQHVPAGGVDAAREVPEAADGEAAVHARAPALGVGDAGGDEGIGVLAPHLVLGARIVEGEQPVVDGEVGHVPRGGGAAAPDLRGNVEEGHEGQLHAAPAPRLVEAEEPGAVQIALRVLRHLPERFVARRALAQHGDERPRATHRLVVADLREAHASSWAIRNAPNRRVG